MPCYKVISHLLPNIPFRWLPSLGSRVPSWLPGYSEVDLEASFSSQRTLRPHRITTCGSDWGVPNRFRRGKWWQNDAAVLSYKPLNPTTTVWSSLSTGFKTEVLVPQMWIAIFGRSAYVIGCLCKSSLFVRPCKPWWTLEMDDRIRRNLSRVRFWSNSTSRRKGKLNVLD